MAFFRIFRTPRPQQYRYVPRFYDPDKEELKHRVQSANPDEDTDYAPEQMKERIQVGLRKRYSIDRKFQRKQRRKANKRVLIIGIILAVLAFYLVYANMDALFNYVQ